VSRWQVLGTKRGGAAVAARVLSLRAPPHWAPLPGSGTSGCPLPGPALHRQVALARRHRSPAGPLPPRHPRRSLCTADKSPRSSLSKAGWLGSGSEGWASIRRSRSSCRRRVGRGAG